MSASATTMISVARRTQEWFRERPMLMDVLFAVLIGLIALSEFISDPVGVDARQADLTGALLVVIGAVALIWRRSAPVAVLAFVVAVSIAYYVRDYDSFMTAVGLAAIYAVAAHEPNRSRAWFSLSTAWAILFFVAYFSLLDGTGEFRWDKALGMTTSIGATILLGTVIRNKEEIFADTRERAERAEADRLVEAERAVTRERLRIAREMHDVVAHGMSLMTVQAAAAREITTTRPEDAARLMSSVEATGRDALADMRRMLGVLRNDEPVDPNAPHRKMAPQPSLGELGSVVAHCIEAGMPTELIITGEQRTLAPGLELAAFRTVQEALTNAVKHGGGAASAAVAVHYGLAELEITVTDTGRGAAAGMAHAGSGHGLIGMRERIEIYDGHLVTGPRPGGGYEVKASLPVDPMKTRPAVIAANPETNA